MRIVIIGGVAGGMSAAARARRLDEHAEIIVLEAGRYVSFANCGLPYHLAGEIAGRDQLLLHTPESLRSRADLDVRLGHRVTAIDRAARELTVEVTTQDGATSTEHLGYDALILSPGAEALRPPIPGLDLPMVSTLRTIPELDSVMERTSATLAAAAAAGRPARAVVVGAGFIGLETTEALVHRGLSVDLVDLADHVLPPLDAELAPLLDAELAAHGVGTHRGAGLERIEQVGVTGSGTAGEAGTQAGAAPSARVVLSTGEVLEADLVIVSMGVRPASALAAEAGLELGARGAIVVDAEQRTSDPHIWAVGDAVEVAFADGRRGPVLLAGPANRQGRRAADSVLGHPVTAQAPVLGTAIVRVFELTAAVTGASEAVLEAAGTEHVTVRTHTGSHAGYYPGASTLHLVAHFSPEGRLLGAQVVGGEGADKRIDVLATALRAGMGAEDLAELELAYAPPFGSAKDPVNMVGMAALNVLTGLSPQWETRDLDEAIGTGLVLDVRGTGEWERGHLASAMLVPLPQLRERVEEVREAADGRTVYVHCASGVRSYLAVRILRQEGIDARNFSGGFTSLALARPDLVVTA